MLQFVFLLVLAFTASAIPTQQPKEIIVSGQDQNGSIFMFGDPVVSRNIEYTAGACGLSTYFSDQIDPSMSLVAMPAGVFDLFGSAQNNRLCAKVITMARDGLTRQAIVSDRNLSEDNSIDMGLELWEVFGGSDNDGSIIRGFSWSIEQ